MCDANVSKACLLVHGARPRRRQATRSGRGHGVRVVEEPHGSAVRVVELGHASVIEEVAVHPGEPLGVAEFHHDRLVRARLGDDESRALSSRIAWPS